MKKLMLMLFFGLLIAVQGITQIVLMQAYASTIRSHDEKTDIWNDWSQWQESKIIIRLDLDNNLVKIDNALDDSFKLIDSNKRFEGEDGDDKVHYTQTEWSAIDKEGIRLTFKLRAYDNNIFHISAKYSNVWYSYEAKVIEF